MIKKLALSWRAEANGDWSYCGTPWELKQETSETRSLATVLLSTGAWKRKWTDCLKVFEDVNAWGASSAYCNNLKEVQNGKKFKKKKKKAGNQKATLSTTVTLLKKAYKAKVTNFLSLSMIWLATCQRHLKNCFYSFTRKTIQLVKKAFQKSLITSPIFVHSKYSLVTQCSKGEN